MVSGGRSAGVTFWAWTTSIAVHLIVLTAFGVFKFSQWQAGAKQGPAPTAKVSQIRKLIRAVPIIPKPKVKKASVERFAKSTDRLLPVNRIFDAETPGFQNPGRLGRPAASQSALLLPSSGKLAHKNKFFGSFTKQRKVCYLVDCSGSMRGIFGRVRKSVKVLTDGFELTTEDEQRFSQKIANLQKRFAPTTRIHTIGFWPQSRDRKMLEAIAKQSGGEFVFVADADACKDGILRSLQD